MNIINTERLYIKPYTDKDMEHVIKFYTDPLLHEYQPVCDDENEAIETINRMTGYFDQTNGIMGIKCVFLDDDTLIGMIPIFPHFTRDKNFYLELGVLIDIHYQNQGFATEALSALLKHYAGFSFFPYDGFYTQTRHDNIACQQVLDKTGFKFMDVILTCCDKHAEYAYHIIF